MSAALPPAVPEWTLADRLRKARDIAGYSQAELSRHTGISQRSIIRYERGQAEPRRPELLAWATACHVEYEWLTGAKPQEFHLPPATARRIVDAFGPDRRTA